MSKYQQRKIIDGVICMAVSGCVAWFSNGLLALLTWAYGMWCYYDGHTRKEL